jgi:hypothetical protein
MANLSELQAITDRNDVIKARPFCSETTVDTRVLYFQVANLTDRPITHPDFDDIQDFVGGSQLLAISLIPPFRMVCPDLLRVIFLPGGMTQLALFGIGESIPPGSVKAFFMMAVIIFQRLPSKVRTMRRAIVCRIGGNLYGMCLSIGFFTRFDTVGIVEAIELIAKNSHAGLLTEVR